MLNMLRRLDKIRFRGHKRDDFLDLAESPNASDTECGDDVPLKMPRASPRDSEELRDPVSLPRRAGGGVSSPPLSLRPPRLGRGVGSPILRWPGQAWTWAERPARLRRDKWLAPPVPALPLTSAGVRAQIQHKTACFLPRVCPAARFPFLPHGFSGRLVNFSCRQDDDAPA